MSQLSFKKFSKAFILIAIFILGLALGRISRLYLETKSGAESVRLQYLDEEIAIHRVRELPDVGEFLDKNKYSNVEVRQTVGNTIYVRVYTYSQSDPYTETYNWYKYDRNTGKVTETERPS